MKIAIDVSPLQTGHKVRGVGFYLKYLQESLLKYFPENEYLFFTDKKELTGRIDLVHYPYFDPFFLSLPLVKKYPTVVTVHDLTPLVFPEHFPAGIKGQLKWRIQRASLQQVDKVITDSQASKRDIVSIAGVKDSKVAVTYLAAGDEFRKLPDKELQEEKLRKQYNLPKKFALYVGDVTWNKNLPNLIHAVQKANIPLVMIGKMLVEKHFDAANPWNVDLVKVQQLTKEDNNVIKLGFIPTEDLVALYNLAEVFIMPSHYEGFGLPVIEAMQSGCPVITTKNGSLPEVAGDAAVYVGGDDIHTMADVIHDIFHDELQQKEMSKKGLERAKDFTWKKTAEQTVSVYKEIVKI